MGQPGYGQGGPYQPGQPQQPAWGGETHQQPQQPQPPQQPGGEYGATAPAGQPPAGTPGYGAPQAPSHTMPMPALSQPQSSPPYGAPESAPPYGAPAAPGKKGPWVPVLAGTTALFLVISIVFLGLWISTGNDLEAANATISDQKDTISDRDKTIADNKTAIDDKDKKISSLQDDLKRSKKSSKDLADEKETIAKCLRLVAAWIQANRSGDQERIAKAAKAAQKPCEEADRVM